MATGYRLFHVSTFETLPGKSVAARAWYDEIRELWGRLPGVRSINAYVPQFGLAPSRENLEIWTEIESYEVLDRWDEAVGEMAEEFIALSEVAAQCVRPGPSRLVGDYVGSSIEDLRHDK